MNPPARVPGTPVSRPVYARPRAPTFAGHAAAVAGPPSSQRQTRPLHRAPSTPPSLPYQAKNVPSIVEENVEPQSYIPSSQGLGLLSDRYGARGEPQLLDSYRPGAPPSSSQPSSKRDMFQQQPGAGRDMTRMSDRVICSITQLHELMEAHGEEVKTQRDSLHDIHTSIHALPTREEVKEELLDMLSPALHEFSCNISEDTIASMKNLPEQTAALLVDRIKRVMTEREELARAQQAADQLLEKPMMGLLQLLVDNLQPVGDLKTAILPLQGLPEALQTVALFHRSMELLHTKVDQVKADSIPNASQESSLATLVSEKLEHRIKTMETGLETVVGLLEKMFDAFKERVTLPTESVHLSSSTLESMRRFHEDIEHLKITRNVSIQPTPDLSDALIEIRQAIQFLPLPPTINEIRSAVIEEIRAEIVKAINESPHARNNPVVSQAMSNSWEHIPPPTPANSGEQSRSDWSEAMPLENAATRFNRAVHSELPMTSKKHGTMTLGLTEGSSTLSSISDMLETEQICTNPSAIDTPNQAKTNIKSQQQLPNPRVPMPKSRSKRSKNKNKGSNSNSVLTKPKDNQQLFLSCSEENVVDLSIPPLRASSSKPALVAENVVSKDLPSGITMPIATAPRRTSPRLASNGSADLKSLAPVATSLIKTPVRSHRVASMAPLHTYGSTTISATEAVVTRSPYDQRRTSSASSGTKKRKLIGSDDGLENESELDAEGEEEIDNDNLLGLTRTFTR